MPPSESRPPRDLSVIADAPPTDAPDDRARDELRVLELAAQKEQVRGLSQDIDERRKYANRIFYMVSTWLAIVAYIVVAQGFGLGFFNHGPFHLSDSVVIALVTTSTATVVGCLLIVATYLFPKR
jgi:hypothetical protein